MSEATSTPVVENTPLESKESAVPAPSVKASPAQDLRDIQQLLVGGIFPGNMAPAIVRAYSLLDKMALDVENAAK